jgi:hypothetical protein
MRKSDSRHLNIGKHPGKHLMSLNSNTLSFTRITSFYIGVGVGSGSMAVGTDYFSGDLELMLARQRSPPGVEESPRVTENRQGERSIGLRSRYELGEGGRG